MACRMAWQLNKTSIHPEKVHPAVNCAEKSHVKTIGLA